MSARIIDGKEIGSRIQTKIAQDVQRLLALGCTPGLGVILVGEDPASKTYVGAKQKACEKLGIFSTTLNLNAAITQAELLDQIHAWNEDSRFHGILVQMPLPSHIESDAIIYAIDPRKDVDGFHPINVGKMMIGDDSGFLPCTPAGVQKLLQYSDVNPAGRHVVIVGRSNIVGKPLAAMLMQKKDGANATVTICHSGTKNIVDYTRQADILVAAMGKAEFIKADMIKPGAVVIDVGVNRVADAARKSGYRLVGDVDYDGVAGKASAITPVPGGVGPMTITMLLYNTVRAAQRFFETRSK